MSPDLKREDWLCLALDEASMSPDGRLPELREIRCYSARAHLLVGHEGMSYPPLGGKVHYPSLVPLPDSEHNTIICGQRRHTSYRLESARNGSHGPQHSADTRGK